MSKSGLDFSALGNLAKEQAKGGWQPITPADLATGYGLFFDQSLTNTGWVELLVSQERKVGVVGAGTIRPMGVDESLTSFNLDFARGTSIFKQIVMTPRWGATGAGANFDVIAAEMPPVGFKVKGEGSSSRLAGQAIFDAFCTSTKTVRLISSQAAKKTMTGRGSKVTKKEAQDAMVANCFPWIEGSEKVTNEHTRDALMNGLHWFYMEASR